MNSVRNILRKHWRTGFDNQFKSRMSHKWGYGSSELPPNEWFHQFPIAKGDNQSPINLVSGSAQAKHFPNLSVDYKACDVKSVSNNGHSVTFLANGGNSVLSGGPLSSKYTLEQFHFHWGCDTNKGSEHLLDGKSYAAELHLVHWNSDKYSSFAESIKHSDGLCVLGIFLQAGCEENEAYKKLFHEVSRVPMKGNNVDVQSEILAAGLLPSDTKLYFHYPGSLTTPPLNECVQWIVFKNPVTVSESQIGVLRSLHIGDSNDSKHLCDNFRPVQDVKSRTVFLSCE